MPYMADDRDGLIFAQQGAEAGRWAAIRLGRRVVSVSRDDLPAVRALLGRMRGITPAPCYYDTGILRRRPSARMKSLPHLRDVFPPRKGV